MVTNLFTTYNNEQLLAQIQQQQLDQVTHWRWATESMIALTPYLNEIYQGKKPRWVDDPKGQTAGLCQHGFAADDRIMVLLNANNSAEFWLHEANESIEISGHLWQ